MFSAEEEYKRLSEALADEGTYNAVAFKYSADYYDPSQPTEEEDANKETGQTPHTRRHAVIQNNKRPHLSTLMALRGTKTAAFLKGTRHSKLQSSPASSSSSSSTCVVYLSSLQSNATKWSSAHRAQKS